MAGQAQFHTLDTLLAGQLGRTIGHGFTCIGLLHAEQRAVHFQAAIQQLPLGAQFPGLVLFRIQVLGVRVQAATVGGDAFGGGVEGVAPGHIEAAVFHRLVDQAGAAAELLVLGGEVTGLLVGRTEGIAVALEPVVAQADVEVPLLVQGDGVEDIQRLVVQLVLGVAGDGLVDRAIPVAGRVRQVEAIRRVQRIAQAVVVGLEVEVLAGNLGAGHQLMAQAEGVEAGAQVGLVDPHLGGGIAAVCLRTGREIMARRDTLGVHVGCRNDGVAIDTAVTGQVLQAQVVVEIVLEVRGEGVLLDFVLVQVIPAEVVLAADTAELLAIAGRHAVVRQVVVGLVEGAQGQAGGVVEAQAQGGRDTPALAVDLVAAGHVVLVGHQVYTEGAIAAHAFQRLVRIQGQAMVVVGAEAATQRGEGAVHGLLADDVDAATGGAGAAEHRVRALDDLDLLDVEGVGTAGLGAVAQAVDLDVVVRGEAADVDAVTGTAAALAGVEGDAGDVGQHLAQAQGLLLLDHFLGHHGDGLRGVQQRGGVFRRGGLIDLIGLLYRLAIDIHAVQFNGLALLGGNRQTGGREGGNANGGCQKRTRRQIVLLVHKNHSPVNLRRDSICECLSVNKNLRNLPNLYISPDQAGFTGSARAAR
ncbi:hypothetical protein D9M70_337970 [compost metagenome]